MPEFNIKGWNEEEADEETDKEEKDEDDEDGFWDE